MNEAVPIGFLWGEETPHPTASGHLPGLPLGIARAPRPLYRLTHRARHRSLKTSTLARFPRRAEPPQGEGFCGQWGLSRVSISDVFFDEFFEEGQRESEFAVGIAIGDTFADQLHTIGIKLICFHV